MSHRVFIFYYVLLFVSSSGRANETSDIRITPFSFFLFGFDPSRPPFFLYVCVCVSLYLSLCPNWCRYHATSDMDGSSGDCVAAKSKASNHQAVSFVQQLPSRMRVNEGDAVELQVVITGEISF